MHELEIEGAKLPVMGSQKEVSIEEDNANKKQQIPRVSVMIYKTLSSPWFGGI